MSGASPDIPPPPPTMRATPSAIVEAVEPLVERVYARLEAFLVRLEEKIDFAADANKVLYGKLLTLEQRVAATEKHRAEDAARIARLEEATGVVAKAAIRRIVKMKKGHRAQKSR